MGHLPSNERIALASKMLSDSTNYIKMQNYLVNKCGLTIDEYLSALEMSQE